jgi:hypothetical protein
VGRSQGHQESQVAGDPQYLKLREELAPHCLAQITIRTGTLGVGEDRQGGPQLKNGLSLGGPTGPGNNVRKKEGQS